MNASRPRVSIIVPVYGRYEFTRRCLQSLLRVTYPNRETIVVDNASTDETPDRLPKEFPWVTVVRNPRNLGYAGGCNTGMRVSKGEHIFLLNNDTKIVDPSLLDGLVDAMESDARLGAVGPRIVDYDDPERVTFDGVSDGYGHLGVSGVAVMLRRKALQEVGLFDESFFAYYEDRDLYARLARAGWRLRHVPAIRVAHWGSATAVPGSPFYNYHHNRNLVVLLRRHAGLRDLLMRALPQWAPVAAWFLKASIERQDWPALRAWVRGFWDGVRAALTDQPPTGPPLGG